MRLSSWKISATIIPDVKIFKLLKFLKKELYQILQETYIVVNQVLSKNGEELITDFVLHPGEALLDEVEARKLKKSELAKALNILPGHLSELFSGKRNITATTAVKLERELGISAEYWIGLQTDYDLANARRELEVA
ncbi:hypothetical protein GCM10011386_26710 [Parapedobacter defluvii]|uniref:HTH cro/C1-type domain-containing protein n=1 Tax=Parapedobacter defluvii TaxID=2045106 RepID=A0ABQ1M3W1_9SPHI|nr:hypothetical protein GCM10011386_26710 [Parapedobacter defluvii]